MADVKGAGDIRVKMLYKVSGKDNWIERPITVEEYIDLDGIGDEVLRKDSPVKYGDPFGYFQDEKRTIDLYQYH